MNKFAIIVESIEARSLYDDYVITRSGQKFLVVIEPEGWVEATSIRWTGSLKSSGGFPYKPKLFNSSESAAKFAKSWKGHPWDCKPNGNFEVVEVKEVFKQVHDGYEIVKATGETK